MQWKRERRTHARTKAAAAHREYLRHVTLNDLRDHLFFPRWKGYPPPAAVRASRSIMANTVERLIDLGEGASESTRMIVLRECIESFNEMDARKSFIETVEREDICEEFEAIVHACGLGSHENLADEWRDW
jgi:hypothetical protein